MKYPPIDLEKEVPTLDEMFKRTVIVTAISSNHYLEAKAMINSVQRLMPNTRIVIYNLGLTLYQLQQVSLGLYMDNGHNLFLCICKNF